MEIVVIVGTILAVWVFIKIIEVRDRRRAVYRLVGSKSPSGIPDPDHYVKLMKNSRGYHVDFYDAQGRHVYSSDLVKVDSTEDL